MRTTIKIDDHLLAEAKEVAAKSGRTLNAVVEDALRESFARRRHRPRLREPELPTWDSGGMLVNLDDMSSVYDLLDEADR